MTEDDRRQGSALEEEQNEAPRISRRRWGSGRRTRPRPLSDYGQLASRSLSIPEDAIAADPPDEDHVDRMHPASVTTTSQDPCAPSGCSRGGRRRRPISVIGGVSFYGNTQVEDVENLLVQVRAWPAEMLSSLPLSSLQTKLDTAFPSGGGHSSSRLFFLTLKPAWVHTNSPLSHHLLSDLLSWSLSSQHRLAVCLKSPET